LNIGSTLFLCPPPIVDAELTPVIFVPTLSVETSLFKLGLLFIVTPALPSDIDKSTIPFSSVGVLWLFGEGVGGAVADVATEMPEADLSRRERGGGLMTSCICRFRACLLAVDGGRTMT
jgi:hypothetical protein